MITVPSAAALDRRRLLGGMALAGAGLVLPGCAQNGNGSMGLLSDGSQPAETAGRRKVDLDSKIMTFALNLEYMEAEYYTRGAYGHSLKNTAPTPAAVPGRSAADGR